jgi:hypothetical protein
VSGAALARMTDLRTAYIDLERAWAAAAGDRITGTPQWAEHHAAIEQAVSDLLTMAPPGGVEETDAVGTGGSGTGSTEGTSGSEGRIDATTASRLREFQRHLRAFNDAALATAPPPDVTTTTTPANRSATDSPGTPSATDSPGVPSPGHSPATPPPPSPTAPVDDSTPSPSVPDSAAATPSTADVIALLDEVEALLNDLLPVRGGSDDPRTVSHANVTVDRDRLEQLLRRLTELRGRLR